MLSLRRYVSTMRHPLTLQLIGRSVHEGALFLHSSRRCYLMGCLRAKHKRCCIPEVFSIVGQAYIDGIMQYPGDMEQDIEHGIVILKEFFLE